VPSIHQRGDHMGVTAVFGLVAAIAAFGWIAIVAALAFKRRNGHIEPVPETSELPGDEPPAVVNLITHDWQVTREALTATLLDLAARSYVNIECIPGDEFIIRHRAVPAAHPTGTLTAYERKMLERVEDRLGNAASVPAAVVLTDFDMDVASAGDYVTAALASDDGAALDRAQRQGA
jgi:hypothetical protein